MTQPNQLIDRQQQQFREVAMLGARDVCKALGIPYHTYTAYRNGLLAEDLAAPLCARLNTYLSRMAVPMAIPVEVLEECRRLKMSECRRWLSAAPEPVDDFELFLRAHR